MNRERTLLAPAGGAIDKDVIFNHDHVISTSLGYTDVRGDRNGRHCIRGRSLRRHRVASIHPGHRRRGISTRVVRRYIRSTGTAIVFTPRIAFVNTGP